MTSRFQQFVFWSAVHGETMARLVMFDSHGAEFYALVPRYARAGIWRERRAAALAEVAAAIEQGYPAGEVPIHA